MKIGSITASVSRQCIICKRVTHTYKTATVGSIEVVIAVCSDHEGQVVMDKGLSSMFGAIKAVVLRDEVAI